MRKSLLWVVGSARRAVLLHLFQGRLLGLRASDAPNFFIAGFEDEYTS